MFQLEFMRRAFYDGKIIEKVSMMIEKPELVIVKATFEDSYVGRGAYKMQFSSEHFSACLNLFLTSTKNFPHFSHFLSAIGLSQIA